MKGRSVSSSDRKWMDAVARLGCIACHQDGIHNDLVSLHHVNGRTKPNAHREVLPLCAAHHQHDDTDPAGRIGVHPYKKRFEAEYGTQAELLAKVRALIGESQ